MNRSYKAGVWTECWVGLRIYLGVWLLLAGILGVVGWRLGWWRLWYVLYTGQ